MSDNTKVAELPKKWIDRAELHPMDGGTDSEDERDSLHRCADELQAALARKEADKMDIVAHRLLYLDHSGEWVTHGRPWVDGRPDPKLLTELVEPNSRWRIEYAYAAPPAAHAVDLDGLRELADAVVITNATGNERLFLGAVEKLLARVRALIDQQADKAGSA